MFVFLAAASGGVDEAAFEDAFDSTPEILVSISYQKKLKPKNYDLFIIIIIIAGFIG